MENEVVIVKHSTPIQKSQEIIPKIDLDAVIIEEKKEKLSDEDSEVAVAGSQEFSRDIETRNRNSLANNSSVKKLKHKSEDETQNLSHIDFFNDLVIEERPEVVRSITYKLKSHFVNHSIYITLGYIEMPDGRKRPLEIFINSKDLTKTAEFALLGRLLSAIFRRTPNPIFILEELNSLFDPNGGYLSNGRFYASIYAEIAEIIERFFRDIKLLSSSSSSPIDDRGNRLHSLKKNGRSLFSSDTSEQFSPSSKTNTVGSGKEKLNGQLEKGLESSMSVFSSNEGLSRGLAGDGDKSEQLNFYRICPACDYKTLKFDNGCYICLTCGYSKCE